MIIMPTYNTLERRGNQALNACLDVRPSARESLGLSCTMHCASMKRKFRSFVRNWANGSIKAPVVWFGFESLRIGGVGALICPRWKHAPPMLIDYFEASCWSVSARSDTRTAARIESPVCVFLRPQVNGISIDPFFSSFVVVTVGGTS